MNDRTLLSRTSPGLPPHEADQAELRAKRRARHLHQYGRGFDLAAEVEAICATLAARIMTRGNPLHYTELVDELVAAVHFMACRLTVMAARAAAAPHVSRLPIEDRGQEMKRILAAAPHPPRPVIDAAALKTGSWLSLLIAHVTSLCEPLSALLGAPAPSSLTASEKLEELLRLVDDAARALHRKLKAGECRPAVKVPHHVEPVTQAQCREARRTKMPFSWPAEFDLPGEIEAICQPLAAAVAGLSDPPRLAGPVNQLAGAVHESVAELADMVVRADAAARVARVPIDQRGRARRLLLDLAPPPPPQLTIAAGELVEGTWAGMLAGIAAPYREGFSALLTDSPRIDGQHVSEKLRDWLVRIDSAALTLDRRIEALHRRDARPAVAAPAVTVTPADKARAELSRLGVTPP